MVHQTLLTLLGIVIVAKQIETINHCPAFTKCVQKEYLLSLYGRDLSDFDPKDKEDIYRLMINGLCSRQEAIVSCVNPTVVSQCPILQTNPLQQTTELLKAILQESCLYQNEIVDLVLCISDRHVLEWTLRCTIQMASDLISVAFRSDKDGQHSWCRGEVMPVLQDYTMCIAGNMIGRCDEETITFMQMRSVEIHKLACKGAFGNQANGTTIIQNHLEL